MKMGRLLRCVAAHCDCQYGYKPGYVTLPTRGAVACHLSVHAVTDVI